MADHRIVFISSPTEGLGSDRPRAGRCLFVSGVSQFSHGSSHWRGAPRSAGRTWGLCSSFFVMRYMATLYALLYASTPFPCLCTPFSFALVSDSHVSDQDQCPAQPGTLFT